MRSEHFDRVADVIAVLFDQLADTVGLEEFTVLLLLGILLDVQGDDGARLILFTGLYRVAVRAGGLPDKGFIRTERLAFDLDVIGDHERGVKAHAELTDDVDILVLILLIGLEVERTGTRDCAEVVLELVLGHTDTVVGDLEDAVLFIDVDADLEIVVIQPDAVVRQRAEIELVDRVGRVGDQLAQKDLFMGIDGVDHHIQQFFGFCLELLFRHVYYLF